MAAQEFRWTIMDTPVPIAFADFSGNIRDERGNIIQSLSQEHFAVMDAEDGLFEVKIPDNTQNAKRIEIYGQLPNTNRILIYKGPSP